MTLVEFIASRLGDRQAAAEDVLARWNPDNDPARVRASTKVGRELMAAHFTLRLVEAQRRTLARHSDCGSGVGYCDDGGHGFDAGYGCPDLADLAALDREHADFSAVWEVAP